MLNIIFSCNEEGLIGQNNQLPWGKLDCDMRWFKFNTENNIVIMGRKTFESLSNVPLKNRVNIVVSKSLDKSLAETHQTMTNDQDSLFIFDDPDLAYQFAKLKYPDKEIYIIGGKALIEHFLPRADRVYRTLVHKKFDKTDSDVYVTRSFEEYMVKRIHMPVVENGIELFFEIFYKN